MTKRRLVVLVSGAGSNLQAVLDACADGRIDAAVVGVVSNRPDALALDRARAAGVRAIPLAVAPGEARGDYDARLAAVVGELEPDWVVLAGWMRLLSMRFLARFPDRVINLHPALPGELAGTHAIERAWAEALDGRRRRSGAMVHLVPDEGVDDGPVLGVTAVAVDVSGTLDEFAAAIHRAEHRLLVDTLAELCVDPVPPGGPDAVRSCQ